MKVSVATAPCPSCAAEVPLSHNVCTRGCGRPLDPSTQRQTYFARFHGCARVEVKARSLISLDPGEPQPKVAPTWSRTPMGWRLEWRRPPGDPVERVWLDFTDRRWPLVAAELDPDRALDLAVQIRELARPGKHGQRPGSQGMTHAERRTLAAVHHLAWSKGYAPDLRELADRTRVSSTRIHQILVALRAAGLVAWEAGKSRTLRLTPDGLQAVAPQGDRPLPTTHAQRILDLLTSYAGDLDTPVETAREDLRLIAARATQIAATLTEGTAVLDDPAQPVRLLVPKSPVESGLYAIATAIDKLRGPSEYDDNHLGRLVAALEGEHQVCITGGV